MPSTAGVHAMFSVVDLMVVNFMVTDYMVIFGVTLELCWIYMHV
jgi:hypothetical protein